MNIKKETIRYIKSSIPLTVEQNLALKRIAYKDERSLKYVIKKAIQQYIDANDDGDKGQN